MGDIKRKRRQYSKPKKLYDRTRIDSENELIRKYGLKNKKEIWKATSDISKLRRQAKNLIPKSEEKQQEFFGKLNKIGFTISKIADVLALTEEDLLNRRLQTFVCKNLGKTPRQARQLIVHKHILVNGRMVNAPSFLVTTDFANKISIKEKTKKQVEEEVKSEEVAEE